MKVYISNIPKEKFNIINQEVFKVLVKNGLTEIDPMAIIDGPSGEYLGCEYEIQEEQE